MSLRKKQQKKGDRMTDGPKQAGDPWSFLACRESIIHGDFSSYRPIPCREEQQQSLIQKASIPARGPGGGARIGGGEQMVRPGAGASEEQTAGLTNPSSLSTKIYRGSCRSPLLCTRAALFIGKYSTWKPDSTSKNSRIYSVSTWSPTAEVWQRWANTSSYLQKAACPAGGGGKSPEELFRSSHEVPRKNPPPRRARRPLCRRGRLPPAGGGGPAPRRTPPAPVGAPRGARPAGRSPAPPSSGGALASQAPPTASAPGSAAPAALHPSGGRRDVKKVTSSQGDWALQEQRLVLRLLSNDMTRPPEELRCYLGLRHISIWFAGQGKLATHEKLTLSVLNQGEHKVKK